MGSMTMQERMLGLPDIVFIGFMDLDNSEEIFCCIFLMAFLEVLTFSISECTFQASYWALL